MKVITRKYKLEKMEGYHYQSNGQRPNCCGILPSRRFANIHILLLEKDNQAGVNCSNGHTGF